MEGNEKISENRVPYSAVFRHTKTVCEIPPVDIFCFEAMCVFVRKPHCVLFFLMDIQQTHAKVQLRGHCHLVW